MTQDRDRIAAISHLLLTRWDPIGVTDLPIPSPHEYDAYAQELYRLIGLGADAEQLANYLQRVLTEDMELPTDTMPAAREAIAEILAISRRPGT